MADQWYVGRNDKRTGPFTPDQLRQMAATGSLQPTDLVWKQGMPQWVAASTIKDLFSIPGVSTLPAVSPRGGTDLEFDSPGSPSAGGQGMQYADYMQRVAAALLDGLFVFLMGCVPGGIIGLVCVAIGAAFNDQDTRDGILGLGNCCSQLLAILIGVSYYVLLETSEKQATWGKQILGIKVTDLQGNRITVGRAVGRYFARILSGCTLGIGFLMPLFTEKKQTLHDMIAGCLALKK